MSRGIEKLTILIQNYHRSYQVAHHSQPFMKERDALKLLDMPTEALIGNGALLIIELVII